jgi:hypothetical protein
VGLASRLIVKRNGQFPNHIYAVTAWDGGRARFSIQEGEIYRETDCLLEGDGFELPVPRERRCRDLTFPGADLP